MSNIERKDFLADKSDWSFSLSKLTGKKIVDITGFPSNLNGTHIFEISAVVFGDGTALYIEGEHDTPYIPPTDEIEHLNEETLQGLSREE